MDEANIKKIIETNERIQLEARVLVENWSFLQSSTYFNEPNARRFCLVEQTFDHFLSPNFYLVIKNSLFGIVLVLMRLTDANNKDRMSLPRLSHFFSHLKNETALIRLIDINHKSAWFFKSDKKDWDHYMFRMTRAINRYQNNCHINFNKCTENHYEIVRIRNEFIELRNRWLAHSVQAERFDLDSALIQVLKRGVTLLFRLIHLANFIVTGDAFNRHPSMNGALIGANKFWDAQDNLL